MKSIYFLIFVLTSTIASAQLHSKLNSAIEILAGTSRFAGVRGDLGYILYLSKRTYVKSNFFYANDKFDKIKASHWSIGCDVTGVFSLVNIRNLIYLNFLFGGTVSSEALTSESQKIYKEDFQTLKYGGLIGMESEIFLIDKVSIIANATQRMMTEVVFGDRRWYVCVGVRLYITSRIPVRYR